MTAIRDDWTSGDPYNDIVDQPTDRGDLLDSSSVFGDDDKDKMDGRKKSLDLYFAEVGIDDIKGEKDDNVVAIYCREA